MSVMCVWRQLPTLAIFGMLAVANASAMMQAEADKAASLTARFSSPGPFVVDVLDMVWRDQPRARDIPARVLSPRPATTVAKPAPDDRYPVIIFSHGLGGSREGGLLWGRHWASHGYIVVHLQHAGSDESIWKGKRPVEGVSNMQRAMNLDNSRLRIGDVKFALDEMVRLRAAGVAPFVNADLTRVGMSGHSFGAQTTLAVAGQQLPFLEADAPGAAGSRDARIKAAIAFSPNARVKTGLDAQFGGMALPFFSITGTRDGSILDDHTRYEDRLVPYEKMPPGDKYLASFLDGDHMVFGGQPLGGRRPETARDRNIQAGVKAATLAFWNATLKQDAAAKTWLQQDFKPTLIAGDTFFYK